jgi:PD-(D/E)XK nuclease superfamily
MSRTVLSDVMQLTPSNYDDFVHCERRFLNAHLLGVPASDPGKSGDTGLLVHDMLRAIHVGGTCRDAAHITEVLVGHDADNDHVRELVDRHARRCPSGDAQSEAHEHTLARFHRQPPPMFMATARIDAIWVHDGLLDARDYKTGRLWHERVADVPAAKVQAFVLDKAARRRRLRLRLRYEYLSADVADDPDSWEPDADDMAAIEAELRAAVERMRTNDAWTGVSEEPLCSHCPYRSICRDTAAPGLPAWPVLTADT